MMVCRGLLDCGSVSSSAPRRKIHFVFKSRDHLELQNDLMEGLYEIRSITD